MLREKRTRAGAKTVVVGACVGLAGLLSACASNPDSMSAQHVSEARYMDWSCKQLAGEATSIDARISELHGTLQDKADGDTAQMAIGLVLFWPALFFLEGGDGPQAAEFSRLKGERIAIDSAARQKSCDGVPAMKLPTVEQREAIRELQELKAQLDAGTISQSDYEKRRAEIDKKL